MSELNFASPPVFVIIFLSLKDALFAHNVIHYSSRLCSWQIVFRVCLAASNTPPRRDVIIWL